MSRREAGAWMKTVVVSDLHLGGVSGSDVLRHAAPRRHLTDALQGVERLVLLGDTLELRHGPPRMALQAARPVLEAIGGAMEGGEVVLVAGNHDHMLLQGWLEHRAEGEAPTFGLEHTLSPRETSRMAEAMASWMAPAEVRVAYPGVWVREDVYATHGHYLDCHITVPTMERLAFAAMGRLLGEAHRVPRSVDDYEALTAPVYAWIAAVAAQGATGAALNGSATVRIWRALGGDGARPSGNRQVPGGRHLQRSARREAIRRGFPAAVAALNWMGLGPLKADISAPELRRAALEAMGKVSATLQLDGVEVVFGHTHRAGPLPGDAIGEWRTPNGARLTNSGSWTYEAGFLSEGASSPYWPGSCVVIEDGKPPEVRRLLAESPEAERIEAELSAA